MKLLYSASNYLSVLEPFASLLLSRAIVYVALSLELSIIESRRKNQSQPFDTFDNFLLPSSHNFHKSIKLYAFTELA